MSDKIRFEGLFNGVREIIHSTDMDTMLWNAATDVTRNLDEEDYNISLASVGLIKVARIDTATKKAMAENWDENVLIKALGSPWEKNKR